MASAHGSAVTALAEHGRALFSAGQDGLVRAWREGEGEGLHWVEVWYW